MCVTAAHPENPRLNCHEGRGPTFTSALLDGGWISWHHQCVFFTPICNYGGSLNRYIYIRIYNVHFQVFVSNVIIKVPSPHLSLAHRAPIPLFPSLSVFGYCSCLIIKVLHRDNILRVDPLYITIHVYTTIRYVLWLPKLNWIVFLNIRTVLTCVS